MTSRCWHRTYEPSAGEEIERVYFLHNGMVSLVAVMPSGATVETAVIGRAGAIGATAGLASDCFPCRPTTTIALSAAEVKQLYNAGR
jgi:hypothetical protein